MTRQAELEAALAASFDAEQLAVYGDYLQSIGDPRGELIALDLHGLDEPARRRELLDAWFGPHAEAVSRAATLEVGFIADLALDGSPESLAMFDAVLASPGGGYLQGVTLRGDAPALCRSLAQLSSASQRWLTRLSVQLTAHDVAGVVDDELAARLVRATPRLEALEVWGRRMFRDVAHPNVRSLRLTGVDAVGSLIGHGHARWPALAVIDLALRIDWDDTSAEPPLSQLLPPAQVPKLRRLDLSRNEPGALAPHYLGGLHDPFALLRGLGVHRQLTHLRLPSLRTYEAYQHLEATLAEMPALREARIARNYRYASMTPPDGVAVAPAWPWLPADLSGAGIVCGVGRGVGRADRGNPDHMVAAAPVVRWLEERYDLLAPVHQRAWCELFEQIYGPAHGYVSVPYAVARAALDTLEPDPPDDELIGWCRLRDELRGSPDDAALVLWLVAR